MMTAEYDPHGWIACRDNGADVSAVLEATLKLSQSQNMRQAASLRVSGLCMLLSCTKPSSRIQPSLTHQNVWAMASSCSASAMPQALPFVHWVLLYILGITFVLTLVLLEPGGR